MTAAHFRMLARFNTWANTRVYVACAGLDDAEYHRDRGAFFGSIHGTLNHLLLSDRLWLSRLRGTGPPDGVTRLDQVLYGTLKRLREARVETDLEMVAYAEALLDKDLAMLVGFHTLDGTAIEMRHDRILMSIFNHHTHHRGQVHNMLSQAGAVPPQLDIPDYLFDTATNDQPI